MKPSLQPTPASLRGTLQSAKATGLLLTFFILNSSFVIAQDAPGWINPSNRRAMFPEGKYLSSFKSEPFDRESETENSTDRLIKLAKSDLVQQIRVTIKSTATFNLENMNSQSLEHFKQASTSTAEASLMGLKTESYVDPKKREAFAIAWLNITDLVASCKAGLAEKEKKVTAQIRLASELAAAGNLESAMSAYYDCYPLIREMENDISLIVALGREQPASQTSQLEYEVNKGISELRRGKGLSLDEACTFLANGLKKQVRYLDPEGFLIMGTFTYQDARMGSEFASRLAATMEQKMTVTGFNLKTADNARDALKEGELVYRLTGTFWDEGEQIKIIANIRRINDGKSLASMEEYIPEKWIREHGMEIIPGNYTEAISRQKELLGSDVPANELDVAVWTNRGSDDPLFKAGDTMMVFVQVNKPCYIRLIYYLADGQKTLLVDNFQVPIENANIPIRYPYPFICDAPYGSETLQALAQTTPFQPLKTVKKDGYLFIEEDVKGIMENFRGMKSTAPGMLQAEKRMDLTTIEN
ncbi:MAG: DUF4384 domain-containing protein [Bacteroidetes bacterium]|nr:MAG: DUF4384 domain-containing protein [Bacteroidota bacterium]